MLENNRKWTARWITDERFVDLQPRNLLHKASENSKNKLNQHLPELTNVHMLVRKVLHIDDATAPAHIDITADDYYKLYINGKFVGQGPAPSYHFHYFYNRFDIQPWLQEGDNVIAVHVYYQGLVNRALNSADYRQGMIAELFSGGKLVEGTDVSWKYYRTLEYGASDVEVVAYDTQFAEHLDQRLKLDRWRELDYDDSDWQPARELQTTDYTFYLQPTPPLEVYPRAPQKIDVLQDGRILIDFGQEITGQLYLTAQGERGRKLEVRFGEELLDSGDAVRYEMRCTTTYREIWTLSGGKDEMEGYDYKGFRYAEIIGGQDVVNIESITVIVRHYPYPAQSTVLRTGDALLQGIWDICKNGVKYGSQEHYVDCPTREKGQYLGDNTITAPAHALLTGDLRLYRKALEDFARSAQICPGMMAVAPGHYMQEFVDYSLQWPGQLLQYYHYSGDRDFLRQMLPYAIGIVSHFAQYSRSDGLLGTISDKPHLVDWPSTSRDGYDYPITWPVTEGSHNVANAFYYGAMRAVNEMFKELGEPEKYDLATFRRAFRQAFGTEQSVFRDTETTSHTSLHANAVALYVGLVPEDMRDTVITLLKEKGLQCGVYMSYFYLKGMAAVGEHEYVYRTIVSQERRVVKAVDGQEPAQVELFGYWANMLREGATTCYEAWSKRLKWNTSLCHPWASAPIPLLVEDILGVTPAKPGWSAIQFRPRIPRDMPNLDLQLALPVGIVTISVRDGRASISAPPEVEVID